MLFQSDDVNSIDEIWWSGPQPFYLDTLLIDSDSVSSVSSVTNRLQNVSREWEISNSITFNLASARDWGLDGLIKPYDAWFFLGTINAMTISSRLWAINDNILPVHLKPLPDPFDDFSFDLGRLPALKHFKIQLLFFFLRIIYPCFLFCLNFVL